MALATIRTRPASRVVQDSSAPGGYRTVHGAEFEVDGRTLDDQRIAVGPVPSNKPDFPSGRTALLVCELCSDFGCGALAARVSADAASVTWSDFAWEVDYESPDHPVIASLGPFRFERRSYELAMAEAQRLEAAARHRR